MSKLLDSGLVQISRKSATAAASPSEGQGGISRRSFLKILGATSATALTACAKDAAEKIIPYAKGEAESIPGVAVWYSSTCTECSAGCGITVRTREGRSVKIEGNKLHPVNKGGLCGLGQAALQDLYDPDRVRQPMKKVTSDSGKPVFKPISWDEAYAEIAKSLTDQSKQAAFISESLGGGALDSLVQSWSKALSAEHVVYNSLEPSNWAKATELVFGKKGLPQLDFEKPEVVLNFGADFLETWISPCEYAKSWANGRRKEKPTRFIHIEPRASLTAANADHYFTVKPGTETAVAFGILKAVLNSGKVGAFSSEQVSKLNEVTAAFSLDAVAAQSGISKQRLNQVVKFLVEAGTSLVIAGGTLSMSENGLALCLAAQLLNVALGNVGTSFDVSKLRVAESSVSRLEALIKKMSDKQIGVLFAHKANPAFSLPADFNFACAVKYVPLVVSFSSQIDETARNAHLLLPAHTGLESWGDSNPLPGVYSLLQPTMTPVFDSRSLGDILLQIANVSGKALQFDDSNLSSKSGFEDVLKERWKKLHSRYAKAGKSFEDFWKESLERGGLFIEESPANIGFSGNLASISKVIQSYRQFADKGAEKSEIVFYPFTSVKGFDGRAANRPWMQELPDPLTQISWDSWVELHPETSKKLGIVQGDLVTVRNFYGELNLPAYVTPYVNPGIVAVPLGQGHTEYGRYAAESSSGGNAFDLIPASSGSDDMNGVALYSVKVNVSRARGNTKLHQVQQQDSQSDREIARTSFITAAGIISKPLQKVHFHHFIGQDGKSAESHGASDHGEKPALKVEDTHGHAAAHAGDDHHDTTVKQMFNQREHPIYKWGMSIDLNACTGCSACVVACYAENNIPVVGKEAIGKGRRMSWIQISRYHDGSSEDLEVSFLPMTCQHCGNAPCEPVCPVYATYHNEEGLNAMVYNRCVGTRYCANNCSYKVRRFNWHEFEWPTPLNFQLNPDVTKRGVGVMEKCTFCVQRIVEAKDAAKDLGRLVKDGEIKPACVQSCPTEALVFGNLNDPESKVSKAQKADRNYKILDYHLNTQPAVAYRDRLRYEKI